MRRRSKSKKDDVWLKKFGKELEKLILSRGYKSVYDFWHQEGHKCISRASLNYIVAGEVDPKLSSVRSIFKKLDLTSEELASLCL